MKKIIFLPLALTSFLSVPESSAQRTIPLSVKLKEPLNNLVVPIGGRFALSFTITNASTTEPLRSGDTILFTWGGKLEGLLLHTAIAPGQTFSFDSLAFFPNNNAELTDVTRPFCISVMGTANSSLNGSWSNPNFGVQFCADVILKGTNSTGCDPTFSSISTSSCGTYTSPSGRYSWATTGTYKDTLQNAAGCDSIISIHLNVGRLDNGVTKSQRSLKANSIGLIYQWVDCADNYNPIPGATQIEYIPVRTGSYAVVVKEGTCADTSVCYDFEVEGSDISGIRAGALVTVYPNPSTGVLNLSSLENGSKDIQVMSLSGKVLLHTNFKTNNHLLNLKHLSAGIYLLKMQTASGSLTQRVVLLH